MISPPFLVELSVHFTDYQGPDDTGIRKEFWENFFPSEGISFTAYRMTKGGPSKCQFVWKFTPVGAELEQSGIALLIRGILLIVRWQC